MKQAHLILFVSIAFTFACHPTISDQQIADYTAVQVKWKAESDAFTQAFSACEERYARFAEQMNDTLGELPLGELIAQDSVMNARYTELKMLHLHWISANKVLLVNYDSHLSECKSWTASLVKNGVSSETAQKQWEEKESTMNGIRERSKVTADLCKDLEISADSLRQTIRVAFELTF